MQIFLVHFYILFYIVLDKKTYSKKINLIGVIVQFLGSFSVICGLFFKTLAQKWPKNSVKI